MVEKILCYTKNMNKKYHCIICDEKEPFMFMVRDYLWKQYMVEEERKRIICLACFVKRLGRKIYLDELMDAPINQICWDKIKPFIRKRPHENRSM